MYRIAIYRIHYGLDFLEQSVKSIINDVDWVYIFHSSQPWSKRQSLSYLGENIKLPRLEENVESFIDQKFDSKITYIAKEYDKPDNQYANMYQYIRQHYHSQHPQTLMMEPDMVFAPGDAKKLLEYDGDFVSTKQIELWKGMHHRVPQRDRVGPTLWNVPFDHTLKGTYSEINVHPTIQNYNFGFCLSEKIMLYKHLVAIMGSQDIQDSIPSERWYEDKWLNWKPETTDLEISERFKHYIKQIEKFDPPSDILEYMNGFENKGI